MTDPMPALAEAMRLLASTEQPGGPAFTLGEATDGHWCETCQTTSRVAADLLRINAAGCTPIAVFYHCTTCPPPS